MINRELLDRFESIDDLPVCEELLGAYIEGRLRGSELREVERLVASDEALQELGGSYPMPTIFSTFLDVFYLDARFLPLADDSSIVSADLNDINLPTIPTIEEIQRMRFGKCTDEKAGPVHKFKQKSNIGDRFNNLT